MLGVAGVSDKIVMLQRDSRTGRLEHGAKSHASRPVSAWRRPGLPVTTFALAFVLLVFLTLLVTGGNVAFEHSFIYFPSRDLVATPRKWQLPYEEVRFGEDGRLHGWFIQGSNPVTFLWLHGNAGNISHRLEWLHTLYSRLGVNVLLFDYQGYGLSAGRPSEENSYEDARQALAYLRSRTDVDPERIVYYGKSLGAAVAVQLATEARPYRLVINAAFTSIADMARLHYPFLPIGPLIRTRYASIDKIEHVTAPVLVVHGAADEIVPLAHARRLYEAASDPKRLLVIDGAGHNDLLPTGGLRYLDALNEFCALEEGSWPRP
jgi:fermentation-respiration switch protein FrsA (DUF1100 family)